jgi:hypothetical protein
MTFFKSFHLLFLFFILRLDGVLVYYFCLGGGEGRRGRGEEEVMIMNRYKNTV